MKKIQHAFDSGQVVDTLINPAAVLWLRAARGPERKGALVALLGTRDIAGAGKGRVVSVPTSLADAVEILGVDVVELRTHDKAGRAEWDNLPIMVNRANVRIAYAVDPFFVVEFSDGTEIAVKSLAPLE